MKDEKVVVNFENEAFQKKMKKIGEAAEGEKEKIKTFLSEMKKKDRCKFYFIFLFVALFGVILFLVVFGVTYFNSVGSCENIVGDFDTQQEIKESVKAVKDLLLSAKEELAQINQKLQNVFGSDINQGKIKTHSFSKIQNNFKIFVHL